MKTITPSALTELSDRELLASLELAVQTERKATTSVISLLMEVDTRRLYLGEGFSSLFTYCTRALHLSEHAAYNRIETARAAQRFSVILELISEGAATLTTIRLLAPHLTFDNHRDVLTRATRKSKREIEELVASLNPKTDVPPVIRKLPTPAPIKRSAPIGLEAISTPTVEAPIAAPPTCDVRSTGLIDVKPLAPERYKIQFTVGREVYEKFRRAQDLLRHVVPSGDPAVIFERALTVLLATLERRKTAAAARPRTGRGSKLVSRYIPAPVKRAVWKRDGGRCAFVGRQGRCCETGFLEYHHVMPFAAGGEATVANIELRCCSHNGYEADRYFGAVEVPLLRECRAPYGRHQLVPERVVKAFTTFVHHPLNVHSQTKIARGQLAQ